MIPGTSRGQWSEIASGHGEPMSRLLSQDSVGAHSYKTSNSYDEASSARMYPSLSQKSFYISSSRSDTSGRSNSPDNNALCTPTQQQMDLQVFDHFPYPVGEGFHGNHSIYHRGDFKTDLPCSVLLAAPTYNMFEATTEETFASMTAIHAPVARDTLSIYSPMDDSPVWGVAPFPDSQRSSPVLEEDWTLPPPQMPSTASSPLQYSPNFDGVSPKQEFPDLERPPYNTGDRVTEMAVGQPRPSKVASDMARSQSFLANSEASDESMRFVGRTSVDMDNTARDHELYQNVQVHADGLYHCPWEGKDGCTHKAEKLKCNYE